MILTLAVQHHERKPYGPAINNFYILDTNNLEDPKTQPVILIINHTYEQQYHNLQPVPATLVIEDGRLIGNAAQTGPNINFWTFTRNDET